MKKKRRKKKRKNWIRRGTNFHHLRNVCMGGNDDVQNLLRIYIEKHEIWHKLFRNMDLNQTIEFLKRVRRAKANQRG